MNFRFKIATVLLSLFLLLCSCATSNGDSAESDNRNDSSDTTVESESTNDEVTEEYVTLYQNGATCFDVVYSAGIQLDGPRMEAIRSFLTSLCTAFGDSVGSATAPRLVSDAKY